LLSPTAPLGIIGVRGSIPGNCNFYSTIEVYIVRQRLQEREMKKIILSILITIAFILAVPAASMARNGRGYNGHGNYNHGYNSHGYYGHGYNNHGYYNHGYGHHYNGGSYFTGNFFFGAPFAYYPPAPPVYYAPPPPVVYYPPPPPVYYAPPPSGQIFFGFSVD
jgi:hypothetical protein